MPITILTINTGSSSVKFALFQWTAHDQGTRLVSGQIEQQDEKWWFSVKQTQGETLTTPIKSSSSRRFHHVALQQLVRWLKQHYAQTSIDAVGHRVVHGADRYTQPVVVTAAILQHLTQLTPLAPLHQAFNLRGIEVFRQHWPHVPQIACFDTAFHATQPKVATAYALPEYLTSIPLKRYGFHGLSYEYIAQVMPRYLPEGAQAKVVVAHLGQGASLCALAHRQSVATTMGFTALEGLVMGTRCGHIDPGIILYLQQQNYSLTKITRLLYQQAGLLGLSGISSDVRTLLASPEASAHYAIDVFVYRIVRELGSLVAALGGLDALIFTAGIGEHSADIRARICRQAEFLAIRLDPSANDQHGLKISQADSPVEVWVIPTDEERMLAQHTANMLT